MSLGPRPEEQGLTSARYGIAQALQGLALWCPHGGDTSRLDDYRRAEEVRELLEKAQRIIGTPLGF